MLSYYNFKVLKVNALAVCFLLIFSVIITTKAFAIDYYIAASGGSDSKDGLDQTNAWATFAYAMGQLSANDTLYLMDGTYTNKNAGMLNVTVSGTNGNPITFKALNDGQVTISGQGNAIPCYIPGTSSSRITDITIEGIVFKNSKKHVVAVNYSDRIEIRRVSAYNAAGGGNHHVFNIFRCNRLLLEDCLASGSGRVMYNIYESQKTTLRRCFGKWITHTGHGGPNGIIQIYGSDDSITENCIGTQVQDSSTVKGIGVWANTYNPTADRNEFFGNIVYDFTYWSFFDNSATHRTTGGRFVNNVSINNKFSFIQRGDADNRVEYMTIVGGTQQMLTLDPFPREPKDGNYEINCDVRNSVLLTGGIGLSVKRSSYIKSFVNKYNNLYNITTPYAGVASQGTGEIFVNPNYDTATYGNGAYLMVPTALQGQGEGGGDIGAEILYQYKDGVLTNVPLWPWPMEDRIFAETGISVTWETNGGLWKTLDGVYSAGDNISAPKGLRIQ